MKAIVNTYLNKRTLKPSVNSPNPSYYKPGDEIEVVEIVNGDTYEGNNLWFKLDNGSYVWSGGVEGLSTIEEIFNEETSADPFGEMIESTQINSEVFITQDLQPKKPVKLFDLFRLPPDDRESQKITTALLDSGVAEVSGLKGKIDKAVNYVNHEETAIDIRGHGTRMAGLICADMNQNMQGIHPQARLYSYRMLNKSGRTDTSGLKTLLDEMLLAEDYDEIDVMNMSFDFNPSFLKWINKSLTRLSEQGVILIGSGGRNGKKTQHANIQAVITVGVFNDPALITGENCKAYHYFFLDKKLPTVSFKGMGATHSDSAYTAIVSGMVSAYLGKTDFAKSERYQHVIKYLNQIAKTPENNEKFKYYTLYRGNRK